MRLSFKTLALGLSKSSIEDKKNIFAAFSIRSNGEYILGYKRIEDNDGYVSCVDGIRAISILWIMYGQRASAYAFFPTINRLQFREVRWISHFYYLSIKLICCLLCFHPRVWYKQQQWMNSWISLITNSSSAAIDTFLFLSGFLSAKGVFRRLNNRWGSSGLRRYIVLNYSKHSIASTGHDDSTCCTFTFIATFAWPQRWQLQSSSNFHCKDTSVMVHSTNI